MSAGSIWTDAAMGDDERITPEKAYELATSTYTSRQDVTTNNGSIVATNHGSIYNTFHNGPRQLQQPPAVLGIGLQLFDAVGLAEEQFIGRNKEVQKLTGLLVTQDQQPAPPRVVAISGLGGMGKTQLMLRFARLQEQTFASIIWLDASSESNLRQSLVVFAQRIAELSDKQRVEAVEPDEDDWVLQARVWLSRTASPGWLLLMDNYDDPSKIQDYSSPSGFDIRRYFPHQRRGSIVITSRVSLDIFDHRILLSKMSDVEESLQILYQRSGRAATDSADQGARQLAYRLDGLPLALSTAGQFLYHAPDVTFTEYLSLYHREWSKLGTNSERLPEFGGSSKDRLLFTTWNVSYERVLSINPDADRLLRFLVYFDPRGVWFDLFRYCGDGNPDWLLRISSDQFLFRRLMKCLQDHSFVSADSDCRIYTMHQCVHDWLRAMSKTTSEDLDLFSTACVMLADHCVSEEKPAFWYDDARIESQLLHLGRYMRDLQQTPLEGNVDGSHAIHQIAIVLARRGRFKEAEAMFQRALTGSEHALGPDHTLTLDTIHNLGKVYRDQGKLQEAESMLQRALAGKEHALGLDHTSTLDTIHYLGNLYRDQGTLNYDQSKLQEAESMLQRALAGKEYALGPDHTSTLDTVSYLGSLYRDQGKTKEAEAMYQRALAGKEHALGSDHTSTLDTVTNLGALYQIQGKVKVAKAMYQRALAGWEHTLGPDHMCSLMAVANLGILNHNQGKLQEAESMLQRALAGLEQALGPDSMSTLATINALGIIYHNQGKMKEAEVMYQQALGGAEQVLGPDHMLTLTTIDNLGGFYRDQGNLKEAEAMYQRALAGYEHALGPDHRKSVQVARRLRVLHFQGKVRGKFFRLLPRFRKM